MYGCAEKTRGLMKEQPGGNSEFQGVSIRRIYGRFFYKNKRRNGQDRGLRLFADLPAPHKARKAADHLSPDKIRKNDCSKQKAGNPDVSEELVDPHSYAGTIGIGRKRILSTKKLSPSHKAFLESKGISVVDYDAISIKFRDVQIPAGFEFLIFTSKNAVRAFLKQSDKVGLQNLICFCVGEKTRALLEANGFKVLFSAGNAMDLARYLAKEHHNNRMLFICGNQRRDELPNLLHEYHMALTELVVYDTVANPLTQPGDFEGMLFFSPSGVNSYFSCNPPGEAIAYCIGPTTAAAASDYTVKYKCADTPTLESLLLLVAGDLGKKTATKLKPETE